MPHTTPERLLNAIKIDPFTQTISVIQVNNRFVGSGGMYEAMQCRMIEHYPIYLPSGDLILVDEESLLQEPPPPFFVWGDYIIHGIALVVGDNPPEYTDVKMSVEAVQKQVQFQPETNEGVVICIGE